jgi:catechol 2,3-dioxygenase-like lactoylglutathione lyase family enzyme
VSQSISAVALVVDDYDEALAFFAGKLGFEVAEDTPLPGGKRWLLVRPRGGGTALLLARAATPEQAERVGDQAGGRVFLFLHTDDFWRDYHDMRSRGVHFTEEPRQEGYGTVAVFLDLHGNRWDLVQRGRGGGTTFSHRQGQFLAFIHLYRLLHRRGPAETDLVKFFRVTPPSAHQMLVKLEELGLIAREPGVPRSARVVIPAVQIPELQQVEGPPW